ncbi:probable receptor kinase, putative [Babesia ovata]|uniref:Probable receptor kinase, putative n=1 Tax=Babesia ovata TaxID=189622 RepID=A0A2H6KI71_9APIC|nr:probable receptor kinase, putative [Babesia ovata]GBE62685.1 probable receptor kinase, putative [Babesia ovata]
MAIKCRELLLQHFKPLGVTDTQNDCMEHVDPIEKLTVRGTCATPLRIGLKMKSNAPPSNSERNLLYSYQVTKQFEGYLTSEDSNIIQDSLSYIEIACSSATPLEYALGICHATSVDYVCHLSPPLLNGTPGELETEVVPAMLNKTILLCHTNGCTPEAIKMLHSSMLSLLGNKKAINMLSPTAFATLIGVLDRVENIHAEKVLDVMIECSVERMSSATEDASTVRLHCNNSLQLLSVCVKKSHVDAIRLAKCICVNAQHLDTERVPQFLLLLTKMGFRDGGYMSILERIAEKAMTMNSDAARVLKLEVS